MANKRKFVVGVAPWRRRALRAEAELELVGVRMRDLSAGWEARVAKLDAEWESRVGNLRHELAELREEMNPVHMLLSCPACGARHIDEGEYATKLHHTHACQHCGMVWRPALVHTLGVRFLPGFKNEP